MKINDIPNIIIPQDVDEECKELCQLLNCLPGLKTTESCCGHFHQPYSVFFECSDLRTLTRLGRAVSPRYSDGMWKITLETGDSMPKNRFLLSSCKPFDDESTMLSSVNELKVNIKYWFLDKFDEHFDNGNN